MRSFQGAFETRKRSFIHLYIYTGRVSSKLIIPLIPTGFTKLMMDIFLMILIMVLATTKIQMLNCSIYYFSLS